MVPNDSFLHTPAALVHLFANSISFDASREMKRVKGLYVQGKDLVYAGKYYDVLRDETGDASITFLVPAMFREQLTDGQIIEVVGFLQRRVVAKGARIELQLELTEILGQDKASFHPEEIKVFEILQRKRDAGYLDVDGFIKKQLLNNQPIQIKILVGKTGIIHSDISAQLKDAAGFYNIEFIPINLSHEEEIIEALQNVEADVIAIARGGGDRMEVFDKPSIAEAALTTNGYFITALGHAQDVPLLQKVADKAFNTPTALGQHLADLYNSTIEERSKSKAGLVDAVTKQLKPLYEKQIENLKVEFVNKETQYKHQQQLLEEKLLIAQTVKPVQSKTNWVIICLVLILGVLIGAAIFFFLFKF
jgi:hypothetical protein